MSPRLSTDRTSEVGNISDAVRRYCLAIFAAIVALWLRQLLSPLFGESNPYHTLWPAVVFAAWYCGLGPSILTASIGLVGVWYWFLPPYNSFNLHDPKAEISGMLGFLIFSSVIIALGEANRRSVARDKWAEDQLRNAQEELERKVRGRTADLNLANENLRELSGRLQQIRDEERRHLSRELHDSVGQLLAALSMNLAIVQCQSDKLDSLGARAVSENAAMVAQISREIRTISHLLHPPLLDVAGLASALRWYVDGFSERSNIRVNLDIPEEFGRLSDEMEIAIFRMVQECLTNIHRHSGGTSAAIRVHEEDHRIRVEVQDEGKGIPPEKQLELSSSGRTGVGFRGMRERLRQLGGILEIQSNGSGTTVTAMLPIREPAIADTPASKRSTSDGSASEVA
jgi:signal transduction histidine kinase